MTTLTRESLLQPAKVVERDIEGFGTARIIRLTRSKRMKLNSWLRPDGKLDEWRKDHFDLKLVTLCLVDDDGGLLFDDEDFESLVEQIDETDSVPWELLIHEVLMANGYLKEVDEEAPEAVLGKLRNCKQILIDCLPLDSPESLELLTLMGWQTDYQTKHSLNGCA